jgi:hypothetical protein
LKAHLDRQKEQQQEKEALEAYFSKNNKKAGSSDHKYKFERMNRNIVMVRTSDKN